VIEEDQEEEEASSDDGPMEEEGSEEADSEIRIDNFYKNQGIIQQHIAIAKDEATLKKEASGTDSMKIRRAKKRSKRLTQKRKQQMQLDIPDD